MVKLGGVEVLEKEADTTVRLQHSPNAGEQGCGVLGVFQCSIEYDQRVVQGREALEIAGCVGLIAKIEDAGRIETARGS